MIKAARIRSWLASGSIRLASSISRQCLPKNLGVRVQSLVFRYFQNSLGASFAARTVVVGSTTSIRVIPHVGEFDQAALFVKSLDYEKPVFEWLERQAATKYDLVIEIGANIGIFSVFLDALVKTSPGAKLKRIISFEPALEPFRRLLENIAANKANLVTPFRAAVGKSGGFEMFYEPRGHLTNGSFDRTFARAFSDEIEEAVVMTCRAGDLRYFFREEERVLIKIDVEGYEPTLIAAMSDIITCYHPDLIIEVLPGTAEALDGYEFLRDYGRFLITPRGLEKSKEVIAHREHRDWLFKWNS